MQYKVKKKGTGHAVGDTVTLNARQAKYHLATGHIVAIKEKPAAKRKD